VIGGIIFKEVVKRSCWWVVTGEAKAIDDQWVQHYNTTRSHNLLGYKPPVPEARINTIIQNLHPMMH
jgi:hypothetical protein